MVVSGLELVNLCETRKWNTDFHRKISTGKTGLPFQKFHFFRKFSSGTNRKIMFHLHPNRNFRNLLVNGKRPQAPRVSRFRFLGNASWDRRSRKVSTKSRIPAITEYLFQLRVCLPFILCYFSVFNSSTTNPNQLHTS